MQYFPWQQLVELLHLRREMQKKKKREKEKEKRKGGWEIWRFWRTKNLIVLWNHLQGADVSEELTGAQHLFGDFPYQVAACKASVDALRSLIAHREYALEFHISM